MPPIVCVAPVVLTVPVPSSVAPDTQVSWNASEFSVRVSPPERTAFARWTTEPDLAVMGPLRVPEALRTEYALTSISTPVLERLTSPPLIFTDETLARESVSSSCEVFVVERTSVSAEIAEVIVEVPEPPAWM